MPVPRDRLGPQGRHRLAHGLEEDFCVEWAGRERRLQGDTPIGPSREISPLKERFPQDGLGFLKSDLEVESAEFTVAYPVMAEVYVDRILDRTEFRALCDRYQTAEAILEHLE